jgi:hypothetical protein
MFRLLDAMFCPSTPWVYSWYTWGRPRGNGQKSFSQEVSWRDWREREGLEREGLEREELEREGLEREGYERDGYDRKRLEREDLKGFVLALP